MTGEITVQTRSALMDAADRLAERILETPEGSYTLPQLYGPNKTRFIDRLVEQVERGAGRKHEFIVTVRLSLGGVSEGVPQDLIYELYRLVIYENEYRLRKYLPRKAIDLFVKNYQAITTETENRRRKGREEIREERARAMAGRWQQGGVTAGGAVGPLNAEVGYQHRRGADVEDSAARISKIYDEESSSWKTEKLTDGQAARRLYRLVDELCKKELVFHASGWELKKRALRRKLEQEEIVESIRKSYKGSCLESLLDLVFFLPILIGKVLRDLAAFAARIFPGGEKFLGKKQVRALFVIDGIDQSDPGTERLLPLLEDILAANLHSVLVLFFYGSEPGVTGPNG